MYFETSDIMHWIAGQSGQPPLSACSAGRTMTLWMEDDTGATEETMGPWQSPHTNTLWSPRTQYVISQFLISVQDLRDLNVPGALSLARALLGNNIPYNRLNIIQ